MPMTMTQKILAHSAGLKSVVPGQLIESCIDIALGNDITAAVAVDQFEKNGLCVKNPQKTVLVMDHFTPNKDIKSAQMVSKIRSFAHLNGISNYFEGKNSGIEHVLLPEKGFVAPGSVIIGADSHTCTYGALGAFSTGIGSTDLAAAMATGKCWFKVPSAIKVTLCGKPNSYVCGKDIILKLIGTIGVSGALYKSLEFFGEGVKYLTMADRFTICNMAIEAGAKNGIFSVDDTAREYLNECGVTNYTEFSADDDAVYDQTVIIDLNELEPLVAMPHLPENIKKAGNFLPGEVVINQAVIGSCTNGRIEDLRIAAKIINNNQIADGVRCIIIPGTQKIYLQALREGILEQFAAAGAIISPPTCGPCLGGHMGILAEGETAIATTNRNFVGRMGHPNSKVYLSSPAVAAASAIKGYICLPYEAEE